MLLNIFFPIFSALPSILNCVDEVNDPMIGNGYCDDETNNPDCIYDGGDCCLSIANTDHCSECVCATTGVITSPGFPGEYSNDLDVFWHIQVPSEKLIEITFNSFDVDGTPSCNPSFDALTIYDGNSNESPLIGTYCNVGSVPPSSQISSNNEVFIHFHTDGYQDNDNGFKLEYHPYSKNFKKVSSYHMLILLNSLYLGLCIRLKLKSIKIMLNVKTERNYLIY